MMISFSFNLECKGIQLIGIFMMFLVAFGSATSYFVYYFTYKKLARYFLVNMFRFRSSYALMIILYGIRPFLKGAIHAFAHDYWTVQIWMLIGT